MVKSKTRVDGRTPSQLRAVKFTMGVMKFADSSCLVEWGNTKVICTATLQDKVPRFLRDTGRGWVTGEYGMLPRSSGNRIERESVRGRLSGRTQEIQRLIGRSLRTVVDLSEIGERTIIIDCDVIQADGGTRCASVTGGYIALADLLNTLQKRKVIRTNPISDMVAAVSVGIVGGKAFLDLNYAEDSTADVDMNVILAGNGKFIEIQGTAERAPFGQSDLSKLLKLANQGAQHIFALQEKVLGKPPRRKR